MWKLKKQNKTKNYQKYFLACFAVRLFSSPEYAQFWVFRGTCVSPWPLAAIMSVSVLQFVLSWHWNLRQLKARLVFPLQSTSICHFYGRDVEIIFRLFWLRTKWNGKELISAIAVKEQLLLLRYKSEPSIVESVFSKSSACYQYYRSDFSVAHGSKNDIEKKYRPWPVAKNWKYSNFF